MKLFFLEKFEITYKTATAYLSVAALIDKYPLLLKSGLTFDQLRRHGNRMTTYFNTYPDFGLDETITATDGAGQSTITTNPNAVQVPDVAPQHADFEHIITTEEQEEDFPFFNELCTQQG